MTTRTSSKALLARACAVIPGGVNSPVRAFGAVGGVPPFIERAAGATVTDSEGTTYLDFIGSWGPLMLGHAAAPVIEAVQAAATQGTTYGLPTRAEIDLAERVVAMSPVCDLVRFVSSGTEAVMSAVRLARAATARDLIVKFEGCYHGHADHLLVAAGSGLTTFGVPSSAGVPDAFTEKTLVLPLDDEDALTTCFEQHGTQVAAVLIEPMPANHGLLLQRPTFLRRLRELTTDAGALLIFDEVISGFRIAPGGAAARYAIQPDLVTYGKVVGGGLPAGAFGGPQRFMDLLAPCGPVYQAGTLSGNPLAMAAGRATLDALQTQDGWQVLETLGRYLEAQVQPILAPHDICFVREGSVFWLAFDTSTPPRAAGEIPATAADRYKTVFQSLRDQGILLAPSAYEVGFLSLAHTREHMDQFATALSKALA